MKQFYYDLKIIFSDKITLFFALIFPLILLVLINVVQADFSNKKVVIGVNDPTMQLESDSVVYKQVDDYKESLNKGEIDVYFEDSTLYVKKNSYYTSTLAEMINYYSLQQGTPHDIQNIPVKRIGDYYSILLMQGLYVMFVILTIFNNYTDAKTGVGFRMRLISGNERKKIMLKSFFVCFVFESLSIAMGYGYLLYNKIVEFDLEKILYILLLILVAQCLGLVFANMRKLNTQMKLIVTVLVAQTLTFLGGGFGSSTLQYIISEKVPLVQYISPANIVNQLILKGFNLFHVVYLLVFGFVCLGIAYYLGGKKE